jgi:hypothetical protein
MMRKVLRCGFFGLVVGLSPFTGAGSQELSRTAKADLAQLAWLAGGWVSTDGGAKVEERWTPAEGGAMLGVSRTIKGGKLVAFEFLRIAEREGTVAYLAQPGGRYPPTVFPVTQIDGSSVTFGNPKHDFPKTIRYAKRPDGTLEASIAGTADQPKESWVFKRVQ